MDQLKEWFTLESCSRSAAQFDFEKLKWLNNHYLRQRPGEQLAAWVEPRLMAQGISPSQGPSLAAVCDLLKDRANTLVELAESARMFYEESHPEPSALAERLQGNVPQALTALAQRLPEPLDAAQASALMKQVLAESGLKMPQLAMALRLVLMGRTETPSIDRVLAVLGPERVRAAVARHIA